jgi:DNA primase catalytic core
MSFKKVMEACQYLLYHTPEAEETLFYLDKRLNRTTQELFGFGYFPCANRLNLLTNLVGEQCLQELELLRHKEVYDAYTARNIDICFFEQHPLVMPFRDVYGNIVAVVGRSLLSDQERDTANIVKYKNTSFTKGNHLFGLYEAKQQILKDDSVYIVEGQFDVIKAFEQGLRNVVALGSANMTAYQLAMISRYTKNLILLLDNDEAGTTGRQRVMKKYASLSNIKDGMHIPLPFKDLDEWFQVNGVESFQEIVDRNCRSVNT